MFTREGMLSVVSVSDKFCWWLCLSVLTLVLERRHYFRLNIEVFFFRSLHSGCRSLLIQTVWSSSRPALSRFLRKFRHSDWFRQGTTWLPIGPICVTWSLSGFWLARARTPFWKVGFLHRCCLESTISCKKNTIMKDLLLGAIGFYGYFILNSGVGQYPILQTLKWLFISWWFSLNYHWGWSPILLEMVPFLARHCRAHKDNNIHEHRTQWNKHKKHTTS